MLLFRIILIQTATSVQFHFISIIRTFSRISVMQLTTRYSKIGINRLQVNRKMYQDLQSGRIRFEN